MPDLVISVRGFNAQLQYQAVNLVHNKCDFDVFLQSMPNNGFGANHELHIDSAQGLHMLSFETLTPSMTSTTSTIPSTRRIEDATSSTKLTCPGVSIKCIRCDFPDVVDNTRDMGEDLIDILRSRDRICVSVYRTCQYQYQHSIKK